MNRRDGADERVSGAPTTELALTPRKVPVAFRLAELLRFRWRDAWTLLAVGVLPAGFWVGLPSAFAAVAVLTVAAIYAVRLRGARIRLGLLRWGRVATVISRSTQPGGAIRYHVRLPVAHGWHVTRRRWSGPIVTTTVRYALDDDEGGLVLRGREYANGVILADERNPARARCVTSFAYDLDRDEAGDWLGALRPRLRAGMACWSAMVIGWLTLAGLAAGGFRADGTGDTPSAPVPNAGTLQVSGNGKHKTIPCNDGYLSVSGVDNTVVVTGHCTSLSVSGDRNRVAVDSADAVSTTGTGNAVTYHWGSPRIVDKGKSNTVRQG
ncbi:DUF3060 domain-containing protein [Mycobacterium sp. Marseille-P9652]|uniref:DUF3060 domain-containing protein n=1 Tax=Mycobacterium sp. Marseille-P9652 TaxID=2654950 RepID=UPI001E5A3450|nr:DUF3060 domain-containing protein [Mycobacterium sp. Marseille-P9652]